MITKSDLVTFLGVAIILLSGCAENADPLAAKIPTPEASKTLNDPMPPTLGSTLSRDMAQLTANLEWFEIPDQSGSFHQIQKSPDGYLLLTPNESFFPRLGLTAAGKGVAPDVGGLNKNTSFAHIEGWHTNDIAEWGLWIDEPGNLILRVQMSSDYDAGRFGISIGDQHHEFSPKNTGDGSPTLVAEFRCHADSPGRHVVRLTNLQEGGEDTRLHWIEATGPAIQDAAVLRKRWRPAAAHSGFSTPEAPDGVRMWIMEMDGAPSELGFYAPITTPFGYYGPSWNADGTVSASVNFSLWSYGRKEKEPPVGMLSHLLAIGNRSAKFDGFGHEGTGVKIRDWKPLEGRQGQRQAFALKIDPGELFHTYHSYFYATDEQRWRLFGIGRQRAKRAFKSLRVGTFVEVPGVAARQRTGSTARRMRYRGWVSKDGEDWHSLNTMKNGNIDKVTGLTHTARGVNDAGWFYLETGGWTYRKPPTEESITREQPDHELPEYMGQEKLKALFQPLSAINISEARRNGSTLTIAYDIQNLGANPEVIAYHGSKDALTLAERWESKTRLPPPTADRNVATIKIDRTGPVSVRLLLRNDHGQFWTFETSNAR
ncbi:MAG: hypothetical protein ACJASX_002618 [Limisphaerales bacterium]|jgi:hypothetical protein